jgi:hypothetical protein
VTSLQDRSRPGKGGSETIAAVNTNITWAADAKRILEVLAGTGVPFHVGDLLALAGYPPSKKQLGALFATASSSHLIEVVGAAIAEDRLVRVWRGVQS